MTIKYFYSNNCNLDLIDLLNIRELQEFNLLHKYYISEQNSQTKVKGLLNMTIYDYIENIYGVY